jgi:hypothetical protein
MEPIDLPDVLDSERPTLLGNEASARLRAREHEVELPPFPPPAEQT